MTLKFSSVSFQNQHKMCDPIKGGFYVDGHCLTWTTIETDFI